jgi:hypothetical protein
LTAPALFIALLMKLNTANALVSVLKKQVIKALVERVRSEQRYQLDKQLIEGIL